VRVPSALAATMASPARIAMYMKYRGGLARRTRAAEGLRSKPMGPSSMNTT